MWAPSGLFLSAATTQSIMHSLCPQDYCLSSLTPCSTLHTAPNMVFLHNHIKMQMRDGSAMLQELLRIKNPSLTEGRCLRQHLRGALLALVDSLVLSIFAWNDSHFIRCLQCSHRRSGPSEQTALCCSSWHCPFSPEADSHSHSGAGIPAESLRVVTARNLDNPLSSLLQHWVWKLWQWLSVWE